MFSTPLSRAKNHPCQQNAHVSVFITAFLLCPSNSRSPPTSSRLNTNGTFTQTHITFQDELDAATALRLKMKGEPVNRPSLIGERTVAKALVVLCSLHTDSSKPLVAPKRTVVLHNDLPRVQMRTNVVRVDRPPSNYEELNE